MLKILIADDNTMIRTIIKNTVERMDIEKEIFVAESSKQEKEIIENVMPNIVITDIIKDNNEHLKNGLEIIKEYNNKRNSPIFLVVSGLNIEYEISKNKIENVWKCFQKPFKSEEISKAILDIANNISDC